MSAEDKKLEENKKTVVGFYQKALFEGDVDTAIQLYGGKTYKQHTPFAADGFDGLRHYVKWIAKNYPNTRGEIKRGFADGEYVLLHRHYTGFFGEWRRHHRYLRVEDGKVVEHRCHPSYPQDFTERK